MQIRALGPDVPPGAGLLRRALQGLRPEQDPAPAHAREAAGLAVSRQRCTAADAVVVQQASLPLRQMNLHEAVLAAYAAHSRCAAAWMCLRAVSTVWVHMSKQTLCLPCVQVLGAPQGLHDAPAAQDLGGQTAVHGWQRHCRAGIRCGAPPQRIMAVHAHLKVDDRHVAGLHVVISGVSTAVEVASW